VGQFEPRFQGEGLIPGEYIFGFYKTKTQINLSDSANCTRLRAVVLTQYRRVTDRQMDGIAIASTAFAMQALQRAVKMNTTYSVYTNKFALNGCDVATKSSITFSLSICYVSINKQY